MTSAGGRLAGAYVDQIWQGRVDKVLSLELSSSGPMPAARIQGQIDGLREFAQMSEEEIIRLVLVLAPPLGRLLDLSTLPYESISVLDYEKRVFSHVNFSNIQFT
ncbi:MAG: hypothetical protein IMW89_09205 [Ktedonobacteraceae bacterium]|nr:hypothetical protein [Ktedonobacteraceae bacterium]